MIPMFVILVAALAIALAAFDLFAQSSSSAIKDTSWSIITYLWIGLWGALGGIVSFAQKVRSGHARWLNIGELVGELVASAFIGIITGLLCRAANFPTELTWAMVGISGHAGGRGIFWMERFFQRFAEKHFGVNVGPIASTPPPMRGRSAEEEDGVRP